MKSSSNFHLLFLLLFLCGGLLRGQTVNIPLSHWIYDLLERWETQGYIDNVYDHTKPYSRAEAADYLAQVFEKYQSDPERFSGFDGQYLQYCASEFREELQALETPPVKQPDANRFKQLRKIKPLSYIWPKVIYRNNRNFFFTRYREFSFFADPLLQYSQYETLMTNDSVATTTHLSNGFLFRGSLGNNLGFYFALTDNHLTRDPDYPVQEVFEESGWPWVTNRTGKSIDFDENVAYLTYQHKYFYLLFGRDYNQWGSGHRGQLMLSTHAPIYDQVKLTARYWRFKYTHIHAFLQYVPPGGNRSLKSVENINVYWAGNRLELYLGKGIQLGLAESIVYGNQSLELGYLNPLAFYKSIEHYNGDRDNGAISMDMAWRIYPGIKLYGEWFIDDITTTKLGSRWFGNKFGYQAGGFWVNPLGIPGSDALVEYTRIKPYVYTHSVRDYNKYKHYDTMLGHYIGPNSDDWYIRLRYFPHRRLRLQLDYETYRHGQNFPDRNVGGGPDRPHLNGDANDVTFLDGIRIKRTALGGEIRYEFLRNAFFILQAHRIDTGSGGRHTTFSFRMSYNFGYRNEVMPPFETARK